MNDELYFDYNAATPVPNEVLEAVWPWHQQGYANASSPHPAGRKAAQAIAVARETIAAALKADAMEIYFTSGGTESNNWALFGSAPRTHRGHLVVSAIEHKSVLNSARELERAGHELSLIAPAPNGAVRAADVIAALRPDTFLVSIMLANNETGVLQPAREIAQACRARGVRSHVDAVCVLGKLPIDVRELDCDLLSLSSHKMYATKGCGVLYVRAGVSIDALIRGCGQQDGQRGGTENTAGVVAFARAFELWSAGRFGTPAKLAALRDELWQRIQDEIPGALRNGSGPCLPNTLSVSFPNALALELVEGLGARGVSVSAGTASAEGGESHVLTAMGLDSARARSTLRFSLGCGSTSAGVAQAVAALRACLEVSVSAVTR
jgi:cysteine desulfurase